jgi:zinc protease
MTVIIEERHATPIVASAAFIKTASAARSDVGLARLLQRVVLKGKTLGDSNRIGDLRSIGGSVDGACVSGASVYWMVAPSKWLKEVLAVQADLLQNTVITTEDVKVENGRAALPADAELALKNDDRDNESAGLYSSAEMVAQLLPAGSGGAQPEPTSDQVVSFLRANYRPENLILTLVGDVVPYNALIQVQLAYGSFGTRAQSAQPQSETRTTVKSPPQTADSRGRASHQAPSGASSRPQESAAGQQSAAGSQSPRQASPNSSPPPPAAPPEAVRPSESRLRYHEERADVSQSVVTVAVETAGLNSPDWPTLEVLAALLGQGFNSRLERSLVDGQMVAARTGADYYGSKDSGVLLVTVWPAQERRDGGALDQAESTVFRELDHIRREIPVESEVVRACSMVEQKFTAQNGSYVWRAVTLARFEAAGAGVRALQNYRTLIRAVRPEDVQRAAAKNLLLQATSVLEIEPLKAAPRTFDAERFAATVSAWAPGFSAPVDQSSVKTAEAKQAVAQIPQGADRSEQQQLAMESIEPVPVKDFSTLRGPRAFVREDHSSPLLTVALLFQGGRLLEEPVNSGITELMLRSMLYGTSRRSYAQIVEELEQLGARIEPIVENDFFGLQISVLSRNADRIPRLLRDIVEEPAFREEEVKRAALRQLGAIRRARDSAPARARSLLMNSLFAGHPYSFPPHGTEEVVSKLTHEQLADWHARGVKRQLPLIVVVGDTEGSALIGGQLAEGFRRNDLETALKIRIAGGAPPTERVGQVSWPLTSIGLGFAAPKADAEADTQTALEMMELAFNGVGGRLVRELRDKQGAVIDASFESLSLFAGGAVWFEISLSPEKEAAGRTALQAEIQRLSTAGLSPEELSAAVTAASGTRLAALQSHSRRVLEYARAAVYQRPASDVDNLLERASRVTNEDLKRVASTLFKGGSAGIARGSQNRPVAAEPKN